MYQVMAKGGRRLFFNIEHESDREIEPIEDQYLYIVKMTNVLPMNQDPHFRNITIIIIFNKIV